VDRALDHALVVVDEQARGHEDVGERLLDLIELQGAADRVGRAAPELPLIVDGRARGAQVDARRQRSDSDRRRVLTVAGIGKIRNPAVPLRVATDQFSASHAAYRASRTPGGQALFGEATHEVCKRQPAIIGRGRGPYVASGSRAM